MSTTPPRTWKYLEPRPCSSYKQLFIKGTKFTARQLYGQTLPSEDTVDNRTPTDVSADIGVPLEVSLYAIYYCEADPPEVAEYFRRDERLIKAHGQDVPGQPFRILTPEERLRIDADEPLPG